MTALTPIVGSLQGIAAFRSGIQIGGTTITTGDGTPSATMVALRIGDLYIDYTNGTVYYATATGSGSWVAFAGLATMANGTLSGTTTVAGTLNLSGATENVPSGSTLAIAGTLTVTGTAGLSNATLTIPSGATLALAGTGTLSGTTTITGTANVNITPTIVGTIGAIATGASPLSYNIMTLGGSGATPIHFWTIYGAPSAVGPTPAVAGDMLIDTKNGKIYIASAATAFTDWKLVTSA